MAEHEPATSTGTEAQEWQLLGLTSRRLPPAYRCPLAEPVSGSAGGLTRIQPGARDEIPRKPVAVDREELVELAGGPIVDVLDDAGEVHPAVDAGSVRGGDNGEHVREPLGSVSGAGKEPRPSAGGDPAQALGHSCCTGRTAAGISSTRRNEPTPPEPPGESWTSVTERETP